MPQFAPQTYEFKCWVGPEFGYKTRPIHDAADFQECLALCSDVWERYGVVDCRTQTVVYGH